MAPLTPAGDVAPSELRDGRAGDQAHGDSDDHLPEWLRSARRVMRDVEEVRERCRRQMEMIAAQREFLRGLDAAHGPARADGSALENEDGGPQGAPPPENRLLAGLPARELARLGPYLESVSVECDQVLVEFDRPVEHVYFLETAVTSTLVRTPDGETTGVGLMGPEGFAGLSLLYEVERSNGTVVVQVPGRASRMSAADFGRHVRGRGGPCLELLQRYANYFQVMVQQSAACNAAHSIEERMCRWILLTHDRVGRDEFPLMQEYLALVLGVRRPPVTEVAHGLKEEGIVGYARGKFRVLDRRRLEERSCACYRLIREQVARTFLR